MLAYRHILAGSRIRRATRIANQRENHMGMTLWLHTLEDREFSKESDDHSLMHEHSDSLDELCDVGKVRKLSDFFDFTDIEYNLGDDFDDDADDLEMAIDPETGYGYGIDDMQWFAADEGLATLQKLREQVAAAAMTELDVDDRHAMLEELDDCLKRLAVTAERGGKFHLAVIE
jgi:hypothetical protein